MTRKSSNTTSKARLSDAPVGSLVPMPNGGALRNGGPNKGGPGRPPEAIRAQSREAYERIIAEIQSRDLTDASLSELALLANTVGRYGMGTANRLDVASVMSAAELHIDAFRRVANHRNAVLASPEPDASPLAP